jgi:hypothetical protein
LNTLFRILLISFFITGCSSRNTVYNTGPDLIIQNIDVISEYNDGYDRYGMPLRSEFKTLDITVRIKNIGSESFNSDLYIASTSTEEDFRLNNYNNFRLVEPAAILPDESLEVRYYSRIERNTSAVKFQVNYHSDQNKIARETDYFNNTYQVKL